MSKKNVIFLSIGGTFVLFAVAMVFVLDVFHWTRLDLTKISDVYLASSVYDKDNNYVSGMYAKENREFVSISSLNDYVCKAFIAAEDKRFYEHKGIDLTRIFGALIHDIKTMSLSQGASTITQQLIKLTHLTSEKTISRKAQEAFLAMELERKLTKNEILEAYLNTVYFGGGAYGINAASETYFDVSAEELSIAQAALLAGIIKAPSSYSPYSNMDAAMSRQKYVLSEMEKLKYISPEEANEAENEEINISEKNNTTVAAWYIDEVLSEAKSALNLPTDELLSGGYRIFTALDIDMQVSAETIMENDETYPESAAQGALIAMNVKTGEIEALVGGRRYEVSRGLNRATGARRQPGSAIKPISTYAAAVDKYNYVPTSIVYDVKREYQNGYAPGNINGIYNGNVTMRRALSKSYNAAAVDLADTIGIGEVFSYAKRFHLTLDDSDKNLSFALGSMKYGVTPSEMCAAYCVLGNGGMYNEPHCIRRIEDKYGKIVYEYSGNPERILSKESAYIITSMLETAVSNGTASALSALSGEIAAKTGTAGLDNGDTSDAWTVAYSPNTAVAVWMGMDSNDNGGMAKGVVGGGHPARAVMNFYAQQSRLLTETFSVPDGVNRILIDKYLLDNENKVALSTENTPEKYVSYEVFLKGYEINETSKIWDKPVPVNDLSVDRSGTDSIIRFTSQSDYTEYLLIKEKDEVSEISAILTGKAGEEVTYSDKGLKESETYSYSIIPRNKLLFEEGIMLTGGKSNTVVCQPSGLLGSLTRIFSREIESSDINTEDLSLFH